MYLYYSFSCPNDPNCCDWRSTDASSSKKLSAAVLLQGCGFCCFWDASDALPLSAQCEPSHWLECAMLYSPCSLRRHELRSDSQRRDQHTPDTQGWERRKRMLRGPPGWEPSQRSQRTDWTLVSVYLKHQQHTTVLYRSNVICFASKLVAKTSLLLHFSQCVTKNDPDLLTCSSSVAVQMAPTNLFQRRNSGKDINISATKLTNGVQYSLAEL